MAVEAATIKKGVELMLEAGLKVAQGQQRFTAQSIVTWCLLFDDWTDAEFLAACQKMAKSATFFPSVGEIRATASEGLEEKVEEGWQRARALVKRFAPWGSMWLSDAEGDGACLYALSALGTDRIINMTDDSRAMVAAEFRRVYKMALAKGYEERHLRGLSERQNGQFIGENPSDPKLYGRPELQELPAEALRDMLEDGEVVPALPQGFKAPMLKSL